MTQTTTPKPAANTAKKNRLFNGQPCPNPIEIVEYLNKHVIGQAEAKRKLAVAVYNHYMRVQANLCGMGDTGDFADVEIDKSNVLMMGGTGTGKTYLIQNIAKMLDVPCHIHDCTKLTESGYVGDDVENVLTGLLQAADYDVERAQVGIVCLDEVDKLAGHGGNVSTTRDVGGVGVQQGLLKIVEGSVVGVMPNGGRKHPEARHIPIDTTNILFIGMGAFVGIEQIVASRSQQKAHSIGFSLATEGTEEQTEVDLLDCVTPDDLRKFGMIPEFIGRFPVITHTNNLELQDLVRIITEPQNAIIKQYQKLASFSGKKLSFTKDAIETIAEAAIISNTGARGLRGIIEKVLNDLMFSMCATRNKKVVVDKDYCLKSLTHYLKQAG